MDRQGGDGACDDSGAEKRDGERVHRVGWWIEGWQQRKVKKVKLRGQRKSWKVKDLNIGRVGGLRRG